MGVNFNVMNLGKAVLLDPEQMGYKDSLEIINKKRRIRNASLILKKRDERKKIGFFVKEKKKRPFLPMHFCQNTLLQHFNIMFKEKSRYMRLTSLLFIYRYKTSLLWNSLYSTPAFWHI